jgi:hypothetical protein
MSPFRFYLVQLMRDIVKFYYTRKFFRINHIHHVVRMLTAGRPKWKRCIQLIAVDNYCLPVRGFSLGRNGKHSTSVCPANLEHAFWAAFDEGRAVYQLRKETNQLPQPLSP